jgi:hypothetical protein
MTKVYAEAAMILFLTKKQKKETRHMRASHRRHGKTPEPEGF